MITAMLLFALTLIEDDPKSAGPTFLGPTVSSKSAWRMVSFTGTAPRRLADPFDRGTRIQTRASL
ncbi:hypothetical protein SAMN05444166_4463 [Singulisphaera sp. GP187]|nr:hypothetical protein SAMN05444166_4463 [Singulisphaera sp. GP187]